MTNTYNIGPDVWFNGNHLNTVSGLLVTSTNPHYPPRRTIINAQIANSDKTKTSSGFWTSRRIQVTVSIARNTRTLLEQAIDSLNIMLQGIEKELLFNQSGALRRYTATMDSMDIKRDDGGHAEIAILFTCSDNMGYDTAYTQLFALTGLTASTRTDQPIIGGTADWQMPVFTITYNSVTYPGSTAAMSVGNDNNGQSIFIDRQWLAGDVLIIDCLNKVVTVNGVATDPEGAIPEFRRGASSMTYSDDFTTRNFSYSVKYYKRYV